MEQMLLRVYTFLHVVITSCAWTDNIVHWTTTLSKVADCGVYMGMECMLKEIYSTTMHSLT